MSKGFSITYETVTPESAEDGEAADLGFYMQEISFTEAMSYLRNIGALGCYCEADGYPLSTPRWFTFYQVEEDFRTGETTSYALHLPENLTSSSRMRIARAVGCYGTKRSKG